MTATTTFTIAPNGSCTGATCTASAAGAHTVTGTHSGKSATATLQVSAPTLDHIVISPPTASIAAGGSRAFTAEGFDAQNNSLGDVTSSTTFTIAPNGSCTGNACTATTVGAHTVTGNNNGKTSTATLTVTAGPLDHLALSPASATIAPGGSQSYTAEGRDQYDNPLGDRTASTTFTIAPNGSCTGATCTATLSGAHTVTGTSGGKTGTATLTVGAGPLDRITISPATATIARGDSQQYTAQGFDAQNNSLGDVTSSTTFTIAPNGSCTGNACTATVGGPHTVTGTNSGKTSTASLSVSFVTNPGFETEHDRLEHLGLGVGRHAREGGRRALRRMGGTDHQHGDDDRQLRRPPGLAELRDDDVGRHVHGQALGARRRGGRRRSGSSSRSTTAARSSGARPHRPPSRRRGSR